jgi:hypothetical protein
MNAPVDKKTEPRKLILPRFKDAAYERNIWQAVIEAGVSFEDVQNPTFWAHVSGKIKQNDRIEVIAEDGAYFAELLVLDCDRLWAKTAVLRFVELSAPDIAAELLTPLSCGYKVEYKGPTLKHVVIRLSDNVIVREGIARKGDAQAWITEHVKALAR